MRIPLSTYRFQFNSSFRFADATRLIPYLKRLGISDVYSSPVFKARPGSTHGYDVTDPTELNPEIGTEDEFEEMSAGLQSSRMGLLFDVVPNHMAVSLDNPWWYDLLENGRQSRFSEYFDIDWSPVTGIFENKVVLPILRTTYAEALEGKKLNVVIDRRGFWVDYYGMRLPLELATTRPLVESGLEQVKNGFDAAHRGIAELIKATESYVAARDMDNPDWGAIKVQRELIRTKLWELYDQNPEIASHLDANLTQINGEKGRPHTFDSLDRLLNRQWYRLTYWRTALESINYRRFFNISDLISLRAEDSQVFAATHELALRLAAEGKVTGLRIDHIDGLHNPVEYLERLQKEAAGGLPASRALEAVVASVSAGSARVSTTPAIASSALRSFDRTPGSSESSPPAGSSLFVVIEKILTGEEPLRTDWKACGTTGYEFLNILNGVFVDPEGMDNLEKSYVEFTGLKAPFEDVEYDSKRLVINRKFYSELRSLEARLNRLANRDRYGRDVSRRELERAFFELTACLPVYRTYIRAHEVEDADRELLRHTFAEVRRRNPNLSGAAVRFLERLMSLEFTPGMSEREKEGWLKFVMRWQQFTGPIAAKGVEDTALYVYNRLISLNEVGGDPSRGAVSVADFHRYNIERQRDWPCTLNATSTHDTKRGEDTRARINVLSELAETWARRQAQWSRWNSAARTEVASGRFLPDPNLETLLYQTLLGSWPVDGNEQETIKDRVHGFVEKAMREGQAHSNWRRPNEANEKAVHKFVDLILERSAENRFLDDFLTFAEEVAFYGAINSLSQVVLKIASPGVPDFYQGSELWNFSMVDPDNRRPVDFDLRTRLLDQIDNGISRDSRRTTRDSLQNWKTGAVKLLVTSTGLRLRAEHPDLFNRGEYHPLEPSGQRRDYLCCFGRVLDGRWVVAIAPRLVSKLVHAGQFPIREEVWGDTALLLPGNGPARWKDALTGNRIESRLAGQNRVLQVSGLLQDLPVALVVSE